MQSFLSMKIDQTSSASHKNVWISLLDYIYAQSCADWLVVLENAVIILKSCVLIYCTFMSVKKNVGEKMNCTNVSREKLVARLTLVLLLHKHAHPCHQSLLIVGFFSTPIFIYNICKSKKKSSNKVFKLILCNVITVFASIQYPYTAAVGAHLLLWPCEVVPCTGELSDACGFSSIAPVSSHSPKTCLLL